MLERATRSHGDQPRQGVKVAFLFLAGAGAARSYAHRGAPRDVGARGSAC